MPSRLCQWRVGYVERGGCRALRMRVGVMDGDVATPVARVRAASPRAAAHGLTLAPHPWGGAPVFAAGLHLSAASSNATILESSLGHNPLLHELAEERFEVRDGMVAAPCVALLRFRVPCRL